MGTILVLFPELIPDHVLVAHRVVSQHLNHGEPVPAVLLDDGLPPVQLFQYVDPKAESNLPSLLFHPLPLPQ